MKKAKSEGVVPSQSSLRDIPEIDFAAYGRPRRNPFAKRIRAEGWDLVHDGPSRAALEEMPETDFSSVRVRSNPYASHIKAQGYELQVGRRRPSAGTEIGPTVVKSVRLPPVLWKQLEEKARSEGIALHALVRAALAAVLEAESQRNTKAVERRPPATAPPATPPSRTGSGASR